MSNYNSDSPISNHKKDIFGREEYAKKVAGVIKKLPKRQSYVVGLYSKWGYGKTSTINLIKKNLGTSKAIRHIDLEPWNYLTDRELGASLFYKIANELGVELSKIESAKKGLRNILKKSKNVADPLSGSGVSGKIENLDLSVN